MGLFEKIFKRPRPRGQPEGYFRTFTGYMPAFTSWGGEIYESELVRAAIHARATHISSDNAVQPAGLESRARRLEYADRQRGGRLGYLWRQQSH